MKSDREQARTLDYVASGLEKRGHPDVIQAIRAGAYALRFRFWWDYLNLFVNFALLVAGAALVALLVSIFRGCK